MYLKIVKNFLQLVLLLFFYRAWAHTYKYMLYQSNVFDTPQNSSFLILDVLFLMKQIKHHNSFIYYTKCKSS